MNYKYTTSRPGETRTGEEWESTPWNTPESLFVLIGAAEDIGVRANGGRPGAAQSTEALLSALCALQVNDFFPASLVGLYGQIPLDDLQQKSLGLPIEALRSLTEEVDQRVEKVVLEVLSAGKIPILIGGGHNNAFPLLKSASHHFQQPIHAINLDAHTDLRPLEGRHSGNGFSYALHQGYLKKYAIIGLHESFTPQDIVRRIKEDSNIAFAALESWAVRGESSFSSSIERLLQFLEFSTPIGIELDVDAIAHFPSSAQSYTGVTAEEARQFAYRMGQTRQAAYFHVCETALPLCSTEQNLAAAKTVASIVIDFIKGHLNPLI